MVEPRHLTNAPIREAILDLRVQARPGVDLKDLASALPALRGSFPGVEQPRGVEAQISLGRTVDASRSHVRDVAFPGYRAKSEDGLSVVQLRLDGFSFNRLPPYTRWEEILPVALEAWRKYVGAARPEMVTRVAARYINHIPLPQELRDTDDFLAAGPKFPPEWPQHVSGFFTQVIVHDPDTGYAATVRQSMETRIKTKEVAVLLDIDAFSVAKIEPLSPAIERTFQGLRVLKDKLFFGSLTEQAVRLFE